MANARITVKIEGLDALIKAVEDLKGVSVDADAIAKSVNRATEALRVTQVSIGKGMADSINAAARKGYRGKGVA